MSTIRVKYAREGFHKWNAFCSDEPYKFNKAKIGKTAVMELAIDKECVCVSQEQPITSEEQAFLNRCRNEFLSSTETNDDKNANVNADTTVDTNEASNKRPISPEPRDTEPKRTKVVTYGHKKKEYEIPKSAKLVSKYSSKKANKMLEEKEESILDLNNQIETLKNENISLQKELDGAMTFSQSMIKDKETL